MRRRGAAGAPRLPDDDDLRRAARERILQQRALKREQEKAAKRGWMVWRYCPDPIYAFFLLFALLPMAAFSWRFARGAPERRASIESPVCRSNWTDSYYEDDLLRSAPHVLVSSPPALPVPAR